MKHHHAEGTPGADRCHALVTSLSVEERIAGLEVEDLVPALPVEVLRAISEDYLRTLPPEVQDTVRRRIDRE